MEYWFDEPDFWERAIPISDNATHRLRERIQQRLESGEHSNGAGSREQGERSRESGVGSRESGERRR